MRHWLALTALLAGPVAANEADAMLGVTEYPCDGGVLYGTSAHIDNMIVLVLTSADKEPIVLIEEKAADYPGRFVSVGQPTFIWTVWGELQTATLTEKLPNGEEITVRECSGFH